MRRLQLVKPHLEMIYSSGCQSTSEMLKNCVSRGKIFQKIKESRNYAMGVAMGVEAVIVV